MNIKITDFALPKPAAGASVPTTLARARPAYSPGKPRLAIVSAPARMTSRRVGLPPRNPSQPIIGAIVLGLEISRAGLSETEAV
jgi:hypothetical protein